MAVKIRGSRMLAMALFSLICLSVNTDAQSPGQSVEGDWFVILGSYPESQFEKAQAMADSLEQSGYSTVVINTGDYSNLKDGLWAVVMGPFSKQYAEKMRNNIRGLVPDAYIKYAVFTAEPNNSGEVAYDEWFVILGSFSKSQYQNAEQRVRYLQNNGFSAKILDADQYPNLKNGLWAVAMGPYSKQAAKEMKNNIRPVVPDAYIKSGF